MALVAILACRSRDRPTDTAVATPGTAASTPGAPAPGGAYTIRDTTPYDDGLGIAGTLGVLYRGVAYVDTIDAGAGVLYVPGGIVYEPVRCHETGPGTPMCGVRGPLLFDGTHRRSLAGFVPLFRDYAAPGVIDSVLYYWSYRFGGQTQVGIPADFIAARYDFRTARLDTAFLFRLQLDITEWDALGYRPRREGALVQFDAGDSTAWLDRDFRVVRRSGRR